MEEFRHQYTEWSWNGGETYAWTLVPSIYLSRILTGCAPYVQADTLIPSLANTAVEIVAVVI